MDGYQLEKASIKGAAQAKKILIDVPDNIRDELPKDARGLAATLAQRIASKFPAAIYFLESAGYGTGFKISTISIEAATEVDDSSAPTRSAGNAADQVPLFRVVVTGKNAVFSDMGKASKQVSSKMANAATHLDRVYGAPSRFAWPVAHNAYGEAERVIQRKSKADEKKYTAALKEPSE